MTQEEKAKAYDEAIERAKKVLLDCTKEEQNVVEYIYPELREESEDEKIRRAIITTIHLYYGEPLEDEAKEMIAWIEKQGEHANFRNKIQVGDKVTRNEDGVLVNLSQLNRVAKPAEEYNITGIGSKNAQGKFGEMIKNLKPVNEVLEQKSTDKVEPKFKVGDFIVNDFCMGRVVEITNDAYLLDTKQGILFSCNSTRLWDITKDAKDGDVLASDNSIFIFQEEYIAGKPVAYCGLMNGLFIEGNAACWTNKKCYPATKEQCDFLFQKMKKAGYEWNAEKKELRKIEQKHTVSQFTSEQASVLDEHIDKFLEKKSVWSEKYIADVFEKVGLAKIVREQSNDALTNAIQDAMIELSKLPQQNSTWSEEDENHVKSILSTIECCKAQFPNAQAVVEAYNADIEWLKSLKDRYTWKPSGEQMKALEFYIKTYVDTEGCYGSEVLELYEQLKKLREG